MKCRESFLSQFTIIMCLLFLVSCASKQKLTKDQEKEIAESLAEADTLMKNFNYRSALEIYNKNVGKYPGSQHELILLYNRGIAYEQLEKCEEAKESFRKVVHYSIEEFEKIKAYALYRLGYMYECLGENDKAIAALLDSRRRKSSFPAPISWAEIPARLAIAYARNDRMKEAKTHYDEAIEGLKRLKKKQRNLASKKKALSRTLYLMGKMDHTAKNSLNLLPFIKSLNLAQMFLLKSIEMNHRKWSNKSQDQVLKSYGYIWNQLHNLKSGEGNDYQVIEKNKRKRQVNLGIRVLENLSRLKTSRFPDKNEPLLVSQFFKDVDKVEQKFESFVREKGIRNPLSREAQEREKMKSWGRTIDPNPILENAQE